MVSTHLIITPRAFNQAALNCVTLCSASESSGWGEGGRGKVLLSNEKIRREREGCCCEVEVRIASVTCVGMDLNDEQDNAENSYFSYYIYLLYI